MKATSAILPLFCVGLLTACGADKTPPAPPKVVRTMIVGADETAPDTRDARRSFAGEVHARFETTLGFRIPGKITARLVDAGSVVRAGQPLARLDPADTALQVAQANAQLTLARADAQRYRELRAKNFVSQAALDAKETALQAAQAQDGLARNQEAYTTLVADRAGVIGAVLAEPGQVVAVAQPVFMLAPDGEREVAISLPEADVAKFAVGMPAEVTLWAAGKDQPPLAGRIREISPAADPLTRTYAARVALPTASPRLPLGLSAKVRFPGLTNGSIQQIPFSAVVHQDKSPAVWIVGADDTVRLKPITLASFTDQWAMVSGGLQGGEKIVTAGANRLTMGEKVRPADAPK
jgi:RND family efflux transporter MFP subunit